MRFAVAFVPLLLFSAPAWAQQADATATQGIRLQAYALGSYVKPQFYSTGNSYGATVGADVNLFRFHRFEPSLDVRTTFASGTTSQLFVGGGPRVAVNLGRVQPYADVLVGYGTMHFNSGSTTYTHDNSVVTAYGGGVDLRLNRSWSLRADVQRQDWKIDQAAPNFYPVTASFGVRYDFHFRSKYGPE